MKRKKTENSLELGLVFSINTHPELSNNFNVLNSVFINILQFFTWHYSEICWFVAKENSMFHV